MRSGEETSICSPSEPEAQRRLIVTCVVPAAFQDGEIETVKRLLQDARAVLLSTDWLSEGRACDLRVTHPDAMALHHALELLRDRLDLVVQPDTSHRRKKLLVSDMDSTLILQECLDELSDEVGMKTHVAAITERAMNGELDFHQALRERVALLKGLPFSVCERVFNERIALMPGAESLAATMRVNGAHLVVVSGGFTPFTSRVRDALGFHADYANTLETDALGNLTGTVADPILDKDAKREIMDAERHARVLPVEATLALGDGANDIPMLQAAGLGVAYHAKPAVNAVVPAQLRHGDLRSLLYLQGYKDAEIIG
jgi:phosphoserine phosphatase